MRRARWSIPGSSVLALTIAISFGLMPSAASAHTSRTSSGHLAARTATVSGAYVEIAGVSAVSPTDAWAVGRRVQVGGGDWSPLILHWNGSTWARFVGPNPGSRAGLSGVNAISSDDAWAVGSYVSSAGQLTLIEHWDGTRWSQVSSPSPGQYENWLTGVSTVSGRLAWAVGGYVVRHRSGPRRTRTLIERWDGHSWSQVPSPNPGVRHNTLLGVAGDARDDAWAVGSYTFAPRSGRLATLALHWDGAAWSQVASPNPGGRQDVFTAVAATSSRHVWAVGSYRGGVKGHLTLAARWTGTTWKQVWSPNPGPTENHLYSVSFASPSDVWAVGDYVPARGTGGAPSRTLLVRFSPRQWGQVPSPNPRGNDFLSAVSVDSAADGWAVGDGGGLFLRWNGMRWSRWKNP
jgi:hypothetical protein